MPAKPYFRREPGAPDPLRVAVTRRVRFEEVDSMMIVWHGRYASYFEDARVELGRRYGIGYSDFIRHRTPVPIRQLHVDHLIPLKFDEIITIEGILHWSEAARINFEFRIHTEEGKLACTGYTIQLMLDSELTVLLAPPPFFQDFLKRWKHGQLGDGSQGESS